MLMYISRPDTNSHEGIRKERKGIKMRRETSGDESPQAKEQGSKYRLSDQIGSRQWNNLGTIVDCFRDNHIEEVIRTDGSIRAVYIAR